MLAFIDEHLVEVLNATHVKWRIFELELAAKVIRKKLKEGKVKQKEGERKNENRGRKKERTGKKQ